MRKTKICVLVLMIIVAAAACAQPDAEAATADYGGIQSDFSGMAKETATAYLAVVDELAYHLGCSETEASEGECLHGGFVRDWDSDGTPELCLLLKTSPRDSGGWDGTPVYGWYPPTLYLYTYRDGRAVRAGEYDLYFATGGREAAVAVLTAGNGLRSVRWDRSELTQECAAECRELTDGTLQETQLPAEAAEALQKAKTAQEFLDALGADRSQLLLYNLSGEAKIEGEPNARELRAALAAKAA